MSGKLNKSHPLNGAHTSGIFADMTVDGPEIGTLVVIVDRAKNLPNRKTIGKQDPYCAARLGKEAKKTKTDIRGGQTPRWDQELRFTVSVFHDDKKTDLIGEGWIDLKEIIIPGGNQNDLWHNLSCKGKYAGEVRVELTYYDTRPKPEKQVAKPKQIQTDQAVGGGGQQQRSPIKRRPLPSDPVTGEDPVPKEVVPPPQAAEAPRPLTRKQPTSYIPTQSPLQAVEYGAPPPQVQGARQYPSEQAAAPPQPQPPRQYPPENYVPASQAPPPAQAQASRQYLAETYTPAPPPASPGYGAPHSAQHETPPPPPRRHTERYDNSPHQLDERNYSPSYAPHHFDHHDARSQYSSAPEPYNPPPPSHMDEQRFQLPPDDERPPPPPVHRSRTGSSHELAMRGAFDTSPQKGTPPMRHDVLRNEAHRNSISRPAYQAYDAGSASPHQVNGNGYEPSPSRYHSYDSQPHDNYHRGMQPMVEDAPESPTPARRQGYRHSDAHSSRSFDDPRYDENPTPAPLNLSGRGSAASGHYSASHISPQPSPFEPNEYGATPSSVSASSGDHGVSYRSSHDSVDHTSDYQPPPRTSPAMDHNAGYRHSPQSSRQGDLGSHYRSASYSESFEPNFENDPNLSTALVPRKAFLASNQYDGQTHNELPDTQIVKATTYALPPVPPSLVPGVDPALAREVSDRIYEERRLERQQKAQSMATPPQARGRPEALAYTNNTGSPAAYTGSYNSPAYDTRSNASYSNAQPTPTRSRGVSRSPGPSPNPNHTIRRKSVSPVPPPAENRRHSGIPFGPDSYDAFNPAFSSQESGGPKDEIFDGKIITHDGREVDPSDHLPMESWAPEPEPRERRSGSFDTQGYDSPRGPQGPPPTGRRQLRIAARPQSMAAPAFYNDSQPQTPPAPGSTGRNRLQKKSNRMSALPASTSPAESSPLAPISSHNYNTDASGFTPPRPSRASTWDYPSENDAPQYGSSPGRAMGGGPVIPPKIPIPTMSGALVTTSNNGGNYGGEDWALMEEMRSIDIGSGRSRRRYGGY
ncbi:hypothetical protein jhhlp_006431 [Lomentospora prolificans]|uniref:C2 domain-containing protein n=1 Tax=Lomentospora prolificans TaxID=41688 RepID=A0A2N3N5U4_9PEZI|nr:hypothetical protein jhhlp_006431 [Lomentospora prolificans]